MTDQLDPVAHAQALVRCPSVTPAEGGALSYMQTVLEGAGFECHRLVFSDEGIPDVDNLFARIGSGAPHLCFAGHTDVVPVGDEAAWTHPPFGGEISDGVLYGRGTADMKGGVACFMAAVLRYLDKNEGAAPGSISFLITGDEEAVAINGTIKVLEWMAENSHTPDHCIVGEPTNPDAIGNEVKIGRRGSLTGDLTVTGKQGHVAYQHLAKNPMPAMLAALSSLTKDPLDYGTNHFEPSNLEVITIDTGNTADNIIPSKVSATFNVRFNDLHTQESLKQLLQDRVTRALEEHPDGETFKMDLTFRYSNADAFMTEPGPLLDAIGGAIRETTGIDPKLSTGGGTSDARFIKNYCPVFEFGLLNTTMHQVDEHMAVEHLHTLTDVYEAFIVRYFGAFSGA
ncbi:MAG: succinyl-diaminopimelate desuccinylase [Hyphomicrobiaceae bacterium]